jgi:tRNA A37 methylthiotransferase MiaB
VPPAIVAQRRQRLHELESNLADAYHRRLIGRNLDVLVEGPDPDRSGWVRGTSCRYTPVAFPGYAPALVRQRVPVCVRSVVPGLLLGEPEPEFGLPSSLDNARPFALDASPRLSLPLLV